jgi:hypothetical protein
MYEFKIDLNGDAVEELTYRFVFKERDMNGNQSYTVRRLTGADAVKPEAAGTVVAEGTTGEMVSTAAGLRVWAGKAGDPFWIEPDVLHAVGHAFQDGTTVNLAGWDPSRAKNLFAGHTAYSIVLEVSDKELLADAGDKSRITDNAPDVMFSIAANTPVRLGIGKESVTSKPSKTFPYVPSAGENRTAAA